MSHARRALDLLRKFSLDTQSRHHGLQLASAVVIAYVVAMTIGLPEQFWAVMSTLIVMRPHTGSTFDAGWERVLGTIAGALCGLLGVYSQHLGANPLAATLLIVSALAFVSAAAPALRSAPVAALIVLGSGDIAGHSALLVAMLRVVQIVIGVGVAMSIALLSSRHRACKRLQAACAAHLRSTAARLQPAAVHTPPTEAEAETATAAIHAALGGLNLLASSADRESRLFRRGIASVDARFYRRIAELTRGISQDAVVLRRILQIRAKRSDDRVSSDVAEVASGAIANVADVVAGRGQPDLVALERLTACHASGAVGDASPCTSTALLAAPLRLLLDDLQRLCRCAPRVSENGALPREQQSERQQLEPEA
ncbi:MAG: FUSC family protein [Burkholderiales bacterium]|jgi:uncharacterized membrane protein YccC|nr:FUSC family protein [Burkholderiales bacterium]